MYSAGKKFTRKEFEQWQSKRFAKPNNDEEAAKELALVRSLFQKNFERLLMLSVHAYQANQVYVGAYKVLRGLNNAARELGMNLKDQNVRSVWGEHAWQRSLGYEVSDGCFLHDDQRNTRIPIQHNKIAPEIEAKDHEQKRPRQKITRDVKITV